MKNTITHSSKINAFKGQITVPGDKSISHRSLILASQAIGKTYIKGMLEGDDVINTAEALRECGVLIEKQDDFWYVEGVGVGGLQKPSKALDVGNSGTGVRLLMGLLATYNFEVEFTGDESLKKRPMGRVITPLNKMGVTIKSNDGKLPITVQGNDNLSPITYESPVASAQLKSCIILAGLNIAGKTSVIEKQKTRDHTELMLKYIGADIEVKEEGDSYISTISGQKELIAKDFIVPSDPSSAAFMIVAALIVPNSMIEVKNILMNDTRIGLIDTLIDMGGDIEIINQRNSAGEKIADLVVKSSRLTAVNVPASRAPSMIDEYPILSVAASVAEGTTVMNGVEELKVKESDRMASIINGLKSCGVDVDYTDDSISVTGGEVKGGALIETFMDHRIAMSFLVLGMVSDKKISIDDYRMIATSFPDFIDIMNNCGAKIDIS